MKASFFVTCIADNFFPEVGECVIKLLNGQGIKLDFPPEQTCCGQPAFNSGYWDEARDVAKGMIEAFAASDYVISPSGSCVAMFKIDYPLLFQGDAQWEVKVKQLGEKTFEVTQFLVNVLHLENLGARYPAKVTYHPSCHATRLLGIKDEPLKLLRQVQDLELVELPNASDCCGFGGTFAVKMAAVSEEMVEEKVQNILRSGADVVTGVDLGCLMNIGGRLQHQGHAVRAVHITQLLAEGMSQ
ncbi:MAG: (Fe-S)-binding protein [Peptococcaceae bacterium]|nr:(Fe-S)-binding protein [Peptococcaceae bacterium]